MPGAVAVRRACEQWCGTTVLPLAEALLSHAALVREANVLCMQLGLHVRVQLGVQRPARCGDAHSCHDSLLAHSEADLRTHEHASALPRAAVRVMDMDACAIHTWSLEHLRHQVSILQRLCRLGRARHDADARTVLFGLGAAPAYVAVATVYVPWHDGAWSDVPLRALHGVPGHASCRLQVHVMRAHHACRIHADELVWDAALATELHWQVTWAAQSYATQPMDLALHSASDVRFQRTLVVPHDAPWPDGVHLTLFARPTRAYLAQLEAQDQAVEHAVGLRGRDLALVGAAPTPCPTRVHERYRRWASSYGVLLRVLATEAHDGAMRTVRVQRTQPPTWTLAPGAPVLLSALLQLESHELHGLHVQKVYMGDVCTVDAGGACYTHDPRFLVLQRIPSPATHGALRVDALWVPDAHDHVPPTQAARLVRAMLRIVVASPATQPALCEVPLWFRWHTAPTGAPSAWTPPTTMGPTVDHLCRLTLTPQPVHSPHELWHVDTRDVQVPGGDALCAWHVRGLSLVRDVLAEHKFERRIVASARHGTYPSAPAISHDSFELLRDHWANLRPSTAPAWLAHVERVESSVAALRGWLHLATDLLAHTWAPYWCELCAPFLLLRASPSPTRPLERALLLHNVHVNALKLPDMPHTFAIYTGAASYLCRASSDAAMRAWMHALAPADRA
ncbi:hypothetical protein MCAP1_002959 [Malassezia caprae]|uniref:PH domain-containing protein n=1 Tax=Malassezia caprae TaxID=1381934 RepID=A0AAF0IX77_9BASI|nr:hypothetical protein MCAP1_002959 [Malassezia caprae]